MATFQLAVTLGILCAFVTDYVLSKLPVEPEQECERYALCHERWRLFLALQSLPGLVLAIGMRLLPESPRWHMMRGEEAQAKRALTNIRKANGLDVLQELHEMKTYARHYDSQEVREDSISPADAADNDHGARRVGDSPLRWRRFDAAGEEAEVPAAGDGGVRHARRHP